MPWHRLLNAAAMFLALSGEATAQPMYEIARVKQLIAAGDYRAADLVLGGVPRGAVRSAEIDFLSGMIGVGERDYQRAIASFRRALVEEPGSIRLRLELARAFYNSKDYENAFRQFQRARAGNPPKEVIGAIDRYLLAIRLEKNWSYTFRFAIAPDSNLNSATSKAATEILGLPFVLDQSALKKSGIGIEIETGAEFAPALSPSARLRLGVLGYRREYEGSDFDDMAIQLHAGPRFTWDKLDFSLLGVGYRRWYAGHHYSDGYGARIELTYYPSSKSEFGINLFGHGSKYRLVSGQDGVLAGGSFRFARALSPASLASARVGIARQTAQDGQFAYWSQDVALGYYRDLPGGFSVYVEPSLTLARYDEEDVLFGKRRSDRIGELSVSLLNRRIVASRFTPRASITHTRRDSSIEVYDFKKTRLEVGLTSEF